MNAIESPRLRAIFLLLHEDLQEAEIPGRTSITTHIMKKAKEHQSTLGKEMQVCAYLFFIPISLMTIYRIRSVEYLSPQICGATRTSPPSWQSHPIGLRRSVRRLPLVRRIYSNSGLIYSRFAQSLEITMGLTWQMLFFSPWIISRLHTRYVTF